MTTYAELKAQAEALMAQAETIRKQEIATVIAGIKDKMKEYGLTVADLGASVSSGAKKSSKPSAAPAKYRGPNGELWSGGLGRKPEWVRKLLAEGKSLEDYKI